MDIKTLRAIAEIMSEYGVTRLKMDTQDGKIELDRGPQQEQLTQNSAQAAPTQLAVPVLAPTTSPLGTPSAVAPASASLSSATPAPTVEVIEPQPAVDDGSVEVDAPMVGVFYVAPSPGAEPFVKIGSKVKKGDTLCIIEAMKCMNEITAETDGEVVDICAKDGELVEYGRCLIKLR